MFDFFDEIHYFNALTTIKCSLFPLKRISKNGLIKNL